MAGKRENKKRKIADEKRIFQEIWEEEFFFIQGTKEGTVICLICNEHVSVPKRFNLERHFSTKHISFNVNFPQGSSIRKEKVISMKRCVKRQQNVLTFSMKKSDNVTKASFEVAYLLTKRMKPFTDAELIKECITLTCDTLFEGFSNKTQIMNEVKKLQMSDSTCERRSQSMADDLFKNIITELQNCKHYSLAFDSSTDLSSTSQLTLFVRLCTKNNEIYEDFLALIPMKGQTRGIDYFEVINDFFISNLIPWDKLVSVCTDGCPSMIGKNNGVIALIKQKLEKPDLLSYHCVLHQGNLASKLGNVPLMQVMKDVVNIVNYIRSRELNHRIFRDLLVELDSQYGDVLYYCEVRWLSRGKVLERFFKLRHEIKLFFFENKQNYPVLNQFEWWVKVAFLTDITSMLNFLQTGLQGEMNIISHMANKVFSFENKLQLYEKELSENDFINFPSLLELIEENSDESIKREEFIAYIQQLHEEIQSRFMDFRKLRGGFGIIENPWEVTPDDIKVLATLGFNRRDLQNQMIDLQQNTELKSIFKEKQKNKEHGEFWSVVPPETYPELLKCAQLILTLFPSTYLCEASFSKMKFIKNKHRTRLTDKNLDHLMRLAISKKKPNISQIIATNQFQISH